MLEFVFVFLELQHDYSGAACLPGPAGRGRVQGADHRAVYPHGGAVAALQRQTHRHDGAHPGDDLRGGGLLRVRVYLSAGHQCGGLSGAALLSRTVDRVQTNGHLSLRGRRGARYAPGRSDGHPGTLRQPGYRRRTRHRQRHRQPILVRYDVLRLLGGRYFVGAYSGRHEGDAGGAAAVFVQTAPAVAPRNSGTPRGGALHRADAYHLLVRSGAHPHARPQR